MTLGGADALLGGPGQDELRGGAGDDGLPGGIGGDRIFGEAGNDRLQNGGGAEVYFGTDRSDDLLVGGRGSDTFEYFSRRRGKDIPARKVDLGAGVATVEGRDRLRRDRKCRTLR